MKYLLSALFFLFCLISYGQSTYWQQKADYKMDIKFDVTKHQFTGSQSLTYTNNSPDTLKKVFYHLYFNAFQPGSMMDTRSLNISDPSRKIADRISKLTPEEIGYLKVSSLKQGKTELKFSEEGTILIAALSTPLLPGASIQLEMEFEGQVPIQIRRSGRNNREGVSYSMAQWYPKMCEYDYMGWHTNPYIGREFYGIWGDFDVKITIDPTFVLGGTGYLQNPNEIGHGYQDDGVQVKQKKRPLTWHFFAPNVHDFMWAADPDYTHVKKQVPDGPMLHFLYQKGPKTRDWELLPDLTMKAMQLMSTNFGKYPYEQFSVIQGGDGGMEYPMSTLINGETRLGGLIGVTVHEMAHSWYQGVLGTNESLYAWMDEGFATYSGSIVMDQLLNNGKNENPHMRSTFAYIRNATSGNEQPLTMHADHFKNNRGYSTSSYSKGAVFLNQLGYVIGNEALLVGMRRYFDEWKFKHPTPNDLVRIMEKVADMELDWYKEQFVNTTNTIDYGIDSAYSEASETVINLHKYGEMMMPIDLVIKKTDGSVQVHYIPLRIMRGEKKNEYINASFVKEEDWHWTNPAYQLKVAIPFEDIESITIDPTGRLADVNPKNNTIENISVKNTK